VKEEYRNHLAILAISLMVIGFLLNRVVFSAGFFFSCLFIVTSTKWYKALWEDKFALSLLIIFLLSTASMVLVHYQYWISPNHWHIQFLRLSAFVFPLFLYLWKPKAEHKRMVHMLIWSAIIANAFYGIWHYIFDNDRVLEMYKVAKVLPTLSFGDHIRMSWLTSIGIWLAVYDLERSKQINSWLMYSFIVIGVFYLHLLTAKTGLLVFYLMLSGYVLWKIFSQRSKFGLAILIATLLLPIIAYQTVPSFYNRLGYVRWNVMEYVRGNEHKGLSDGIRLASIKAGWKVFKDHKIVGVGAQRLEIKTNEWYRMYMPTLEKKEYILPSSQMIIFAASMGVLGLLAFAYHLIMVVKMVKGDWLVSSVVLPSLLTFSFETHLEGQLAIFVYCFILYWVCTLAKKETSEDLNLED
jgi:O-antigen ligase